MAKRSTDELERTRTRSKGVAPTGSEEDGEWLWDLLISGQLPTRPPARKGSLELSAHTAEVIVARLLGRIAERRLQASPSWIRVDPEHLVSVLISAHGKSLLRWDNFRRIIQQTTLPPIYRVGILFYWTKRDSNWYPDVAAVRAPMEGKALESTALSPKHVLPKPTLTEVLAAAKSLSLSDQAKVVGELQAALEQAKDPVAYQISREVNEMWDQRKVLHAGESWIKNPSTYVAHIYRKWVAAGVLGQWHLKRDPTLYRRYAAHISAHPEDDLQLRQQRVRRRPSPSLQKNELR